MHLAVKVINLYKCSKRDGKMLIKMNGKLWMIGISNAIAAVNKSLRKKKMKRSQKTSAIGTVVIKILT